MDHPLRAAIESGDVAGARRLLAEDPARHSAPIPLGDGSGNAVPPLHLVCDALFRGLLDQDRALELAEVLLDAGVDVREVYARSGDDYLIAAASLGAERVGLRLLEAGADPQQRGLFGATALHWAAHLGLAELTGALVDGGAALDLEDRQYGATPLGWALHAWRNGAHGGPGDVPGACAALVRRGAALPEGLLDVLDAPGDEPLRRALAAARGESG